MNEKPEDGKEESKAGNKSDSDSEEAKNDIGIDGKVDAIFMACDSNKDGVISLSEAKPYIQNVAAELLGMDDGE